MDLRVVLLLYSLSLAMARTANLALVKSENQLAVWVILIFFFTLHTSPEQIDLTKQSRHCVIPFMKTFQNVVNTIIHCARNGRASIVLNIK